MMLRVQHRPDSRQASIRPSEERQVLRLASPRLRLLEVLSRQQLASNLRTDHY